MQIDKIFSNPIGTFYAIKEEGPVKSFVVSTKGTREICNSPEIIGIEYTGRLKKAVTFALEMLPNPDLATISDRKIWELVLLRGGLNFGIKEALYLAHGHNRNSRAFLS